MDCSPPDSSVHGISQARILEWLAVSFSRESSRARDRTQVSHMQADSLPSEPPEKLIKVKWALRVEHSSNRFSVFRKGNTREFSLCLCVFSSISLPHPPPCVRKHGEASPGRKNSYQNLTLLAPWSETFSPQNCEEINFYWLFHWVYCILRWHSWLTNTNSCILEIYQKNEEEIETVIALLRNLCDFAKRILSLISTSYGLTASLT